MKLLDAPLAIVDLETTGAHPLHDRVTEIAVIEVDAGEVAAEWSTLVNPGTAIPPAIQALTGISDAMVADAPAFADLAPGIAERLGGRVLVAHNARFDYGFLRREFERAGIAYEAKTLCTVKLSRRLYPGHARHNLDSLIARHGLACDARHRALGDARAVWQFLRIAREEHGEGAVAQAARGIARAPSLPPALERAAIDAIPDTPGVYTLYGEAGAPLYVGKSVAMRSRVLQHFSASLRSPREASLARETRSVEWSRTAGELGALLLEQERIRQLQPAYNRKLRHSGEAIGFLFETDELKLVSLEEVSPGALSRLHGLFRSRRAALEALRRIADEHRLCLQVLGFEKSRDGGCFRRQVRRCDGACAGLESRRAHAARAAAAIARLPALAWPWRGAIAVIEQDAARESTEAHVIDHWCWLGTARSDWEIGEIRAGARAPRFDPDRYRVLARHLARRGVRIVELG